MSFPIILARQGVVYEAEATALFAAMTVQPDATRKGLINAAILTMKNGGAWALLGGLWVFAAHDPQARLLNWVNPAGTVATEQGTVTGTTDRGYTSDASTGYIDTGLAWNTIPGVAQNSAHVGGYFSFGNTNTNNGVGLVGSLQVQLGRTSSTLGTRLNNTTQTLSDAVPATAGTHLLASRSLSTGYDRYVDGAAVTAAVQTSAALATGNLVGLRSNASFAASAVSLRAMHAGAAMSAGPAAAMRSGLQTLMAAIGAS